MFWLGMLADAHIVNKDKLGLLCNEARELTALFTPSQHTARSKG